MSAPKLAAIAGAALASFSAIALGCLAACASVEASSRPAPAAQPAPAATSLAVEANWLVVCHQVDDSDDTRLVMNITAGRHQVTRFAIRTPDFIWQVPGQPETARFPAGESDTSPDLAGALRFVALADAEGQLRLLDFTSPQPGTTALEGLRGSLALHESWQGQRAFGSLFHAATGNRVDLTPVHCRRFPGTH